MQTIHRKPQAVFLALALCIFLVPQAEARRYHPAMRAIDAAAAKKAAAEKAAERVAAATAARANAIAAGAEKETARRFALLDKREKLAFLAAMPKGGDLHNHLSGAIYAESYIEWAADKNLCVDESQMALTAPPCDAAKGKPAAKEALSSNELYRKMVDSWSMRNFTGNGHDHFFDTFRKFSLATQGTTGKMLAEAATRAARGHLIYLELMLTPDNGKSAEIGRRVGWDGKFENTLKTLKDNGIAAVAAEADHEIALAETEKNRILKCGKVDADPGCNVSIHYLFQVSRAATPGQVLGQMLAAFTTASRPGSKVVGLNLVQPEDAPSARENFMLEMTMLDYLKPFFPAAHISLHAGELSPGLVPPEDLAFHIRQSIELGHAERIGHGVDVMHEDRAEQLLDEMAQRKTLVEICLSSNDGILGIKGDDHPLATYLKHGVPLALSTDDQGVSRSDITQEFYRAALEQKLGYAELKKMAKNSLEYSFIPGGSLWKNTNSMVYACARDIPGSKNLSDSCRNYLAGSEKARLQFELEHEFRDFESRR